MTTADILRSIRDGIIDFQREHKGNKPVKIFIGFEIYKKIMKSYEVRFTAHRTHTVFGIPFDVIDEDGAVYFSEKKEVLRVYEAEEAALK